MAKNEAEGVFWAGGFVGTAVGFMLILAAGEGQ